MLVLLKITVVSEHPALDTCGWWGFAWQHRHRYCGPLRPAGRLSMVRMNGSLQKIWILFYYFKSSRLYRQLLIKNSPNCNFLLFLVCLFLHWDDSKVLRETSGELGVCPEGQAGEKRGADRFCADVNRFQQRGLPNHKGVAGFPTPAFWHLQSIFRSLWAPGNKPFLTTKKCQTLARHSWYQGGRGGKKLI